MRTLAATILTSALLAGTAAAEVQFKIADGQVTIAATNATVSQILAEWARVGQTRIVNGERVASGPLTLELNAVSEVEALDVLLRSAGGYVLAPRHGNSPTGSKYDRIIIIPTSSPVRPGLAAVPAPTFPQPPSPGFREPDDAAPPADANAPPRPVFSAFPQPPPQQPQQDTAPPPPPRPVNTPTVPVGVSVPGMVVPPPPAQPGSTPGR